MAIILKEIPSGLINGINKVYLLSVAPGTIYNLYKDGIIYLDYVVVGNQITLVDAPISSLYIDFDTANTNIISTTANTFAEIKNKVWLLLGQKSTSTTFSDEVVGDEINSVIRDILRGRIINRLTKKIERAGKLWFMEGNTNIRYESGSTLTAVLNVGNTTAMCETTFLLPSGYVEIGGDIITYTGVGVDINSNPILLGVSGQTVQHLETQKVVQLYTMPIDMDKPHIVSKIMTGPSIRQVEIPLDNTNSFGTYYVIYRTPTRQLIKLVGLEQDDLCTVEYYKKYYDMVNDTDICVLPDDYGTKVVSYLVAGNLGYDKGMPNGERNLNTGYDKLQEMFQYFTNETTVIKQKINPTAYSFTSLRSFRGGRMYQ